MELLRSADSIKINLFVFPGFQTAGAVGYRRVPVVWGGLFVVRNQLEVRNACAINVYVLFHSELFCLLQ